MLDSNNTKVLGGEVQKLKEKWELNKVINLLTSKRKQKLLKNKT